jgi:amino acid permease
MNKLIGLCIFAGGIILVVYGVAASESFTSDISRFFTGSPTDRTMWLLLGGIAAIVVGLFGLVLDHNAK